MYPKCAHFNDNLNRSFTLTWRGHKTAISENDDDDVVPPLPPFSLHYFLQGLWTFGGQGGQDRRAIALPHISDFCRHRSKTLTFKAFDYNFIPSLICRPSNGPDQLTPTLLPTSFLTPFLWENFLFSSSIPPFKILDYLLIMAFLTKNKQCIDTSSKATKINFLHGGNLFYHFYFLFVF